MPLASHSKHIYFLSIRTLWWLRCAKAAHCCWTKNSKAAFEFVCPSSGICSSTCRTWSLWCHQAATFGSHNNVSLFVEFDAVKLLLYCTTDKSEKKSTHTHSENNERTSLLIWMRNICLTWCHCNKLNTLPKTTATATTFSHILRAWSVERSCTCTHYVRNIVQRNTERAAACHHSHRQHVRQRANDYLCLSYSLQHWLKLKATTETLNYS